MRLCLQLFVSRYTLNNLSLYNRHRSIQNCKYLVSTEINLFVKYIHANRNHSFEIYLFC